MMDSNIESAIDSLPESELDDFIAYAVKILNHVDRETVNPVTAVENNRTAAPVIDLNQWKSARCKTKL